jgi:aldehyde dehydrogenase (NAD+)
MTAAETGLLVRDSLFIAGEWTVPAGDELITVVSPHSERPVARVAAASTADVDKAVAEARQAFDSGVWRNRPLTERIATMERFAGLYRSRIQEFADVTTREMGAPIAFTSMAASFPSWALDAFIDVARRHPWEEARQGYFGELTVRREPVGVVAAIVPWNVPQFVTMSKLAPALLSGCSIIIKPAPESPLNALLLADLLAEVDLPRGVVSVLPATRESSEYLVCHPGVDKVAFTGSTATGRRVAALCGERLKRCSLELGGKSVSMILDDADVDAMVAQFPATSLSNSGQICIAHTRVLASRERYDEVVAALAAAMSGLKLGDPQDPDTALGPLVAQRQQERVNSYIELGQQEGARVVVGGPGRPAGLDSGWYVRPTLFADARNDMRIAREEIFGPVVTVIPFTDVQDAIDIANDSPYGLGGAVWTRDLEVGRHVARSVRTGTFGVNLPGVLDFMAPFGGFKESGIGREFGPEGLDEYVQLKTFAVGASPAPTA